MIEYETIKEFKQRMHERRVKEAQKEAFRKKYNIGENNDVR